MNEETNEVKNEKPDFLSKLSFLFPKKGLDEITATRSSLQLGRRFFHLANGLIIAAMYHLFLSHKQIVYILGLTASLLYLFEQVRLAYPELSNKVKWFTKMLLRAEEQLKESAAVPYAIALLLTILTFPKEIALISILTLSIADPMSAIIGISLGKHKIRKNKSWEGSIAFFISTTLASFFVLHTYHPELLASDIKAALAIGLVVTLSELIPVRIDDNLTIPLFTAIISWTLCVLLAIPAGTI